MLSKLLKHEFKATSKYLVPLYLILILLSVLDRVVITLDIFKGVLKLIPVLITTAYVIAIIAVIFITVIMMIIRFYKNLLSDEGYLMFTLPVKSHDLVNSKLISAFVWTIFSVADVLISLIIVFATPERIKDFNELVNSCMQELSHIFGGKLTLLIIEFVLLLIISIINNYLMVYVSIAIGQLFNGHKLLGSFAAYIGISTVIQIISTVLIAVGNFAYEDSINDLNTIPVQLFPFIIIFTLILNVAFYIVTNILFTKKLNLE